MQIESASKSSLDTYLDCPFKWYLTYYCKQREPSGKAAVIGTIVHKVLEVLAKAKKTKHHLLNDKYTDYNYLSKICYNREVRNNPHLSFSDSDLKTVIKLCDSIMKTMYNPLKMETLATEMGFEIEIQKKGFSYKFVDYRSNETKTGFFKLTGFIDLICTSSDSVIEIVDYKTGQRKDWVTGKIKDVHNMHDDLQLQIYNLAAHYIYPDKKRLLTLYFLKDGGPYTISLDESNEEEILDKIRKIFRVISIDSDPKRLKDDDDKKKFHYKCRKFCHFGKTENENGVSLCDEYYNMYKKLGLNEAALQIQSLTINGKKSNRVFKNNKKGIIK
jgi:ATP-dependent helicase/DNAse subunit B